MIKFLITQVRITQLEESFAGKIRAQPAMLKLLLVFTAVVQGADLCWQLLCPKRFTFNIPATLAILSQEATAAAVYPATRSIVQVYIVHDLSP